MSTIINNFLERIPNPLKPALPDDNGQTPSKKVIENGWEFNYPDRSTRPLTRAEKGKDREVVYPDLDSPFAAPLSEEELRARMIEGPDGNLVQMASPNDWAYNVTNSDLISLLHGATRQVIAAERMIQENMGENETLNIVEGKDKCAQSRRTLLQIKRYVQQIIDLRKRSPNCKFDLSEVYDRLENMTDELRDVANGGCSTSMDNASPTATSSRKRLALTTEQKEQAFNYEVAEYKRANPDRHRNWLSKYSLPDGPFERFKPGFIEILWTRHGEGDSNLYNKSGEIVGQEHLALVLDKLRKIRTFKRDEMGRDVFLAELEREWAVHPQGNVEGFSQFGMYMAIIYYYDPPLGFQFTPPGEIPSTVSRVPPPPPPKPFDIKEFMEPIQAKTQFVHEQWFLWLCVPGVLLFFVLMI